MEAGKTDFSEKCVSSHIRVVFAMMATGVELSTIPQWPWSAGENVPSVHCQSSSLGLCWRLQPNTHLTGAKNKGKSQRAFGQDIWILTDWGKQRGTSSLSGPTGARLGGVCGCGAPSHRDYLFLWTEERHGWSFRLSWGSTSSGSTAASSRGDAAVTGREHRDHPEHTSVSRGPRLGSVTVSPYHPGLESFSVFMI